MDQQDPRIGTTIDGRYEVLSRLGEGGMGTIYKVRHVSLAKALAMKILSDTHDQQAVERFQREAKSASMIEHENIVALTDFGVLEDNRPYLVMEFLQGPTLCDLIQQGPLPLLRALQIALQIARGLAAVHDKGVVHRDLKPENIFVLGRQGQDLVKIVDFGLAQVAAGARLTQMGMVMGTAYYISPEQALGQKIDARCDQYALGCLLYEMLTGVRPFVDESPAVVMKQHVMDFPPPMKERRPDLDVPAQVEAVVVRLLLKRPEQRFGSMHEVEQVLQQEIDRIVQAPTTDLLRGSGPRRARRLLLALGVALVCGGAALGLLQAAKKRRHIEALLAQQQAVAQPAPVAPARPAPVPQEGDSQRPARPAMPAVPLEVRFVVSRPAREVTLACTPDLKQVCRKQCSFSVPAGDGQCIASAPGFGSQAIAYTSLRDQAGKRGHGVKRKLALVPIR